ncbi:Uncharacterized oxidoreductase ybiC [Pluralibacter gergoviae]|nr:Uncharacterized oxidoreductase ybiC [Pluralibacter gergoviae]
MSSESHERILPAGELHEFVVRLWRCAGSAEAEARLIADHLVSANLAGHDSHGVGMIPTYIRSIAGGHLQINQHARLTKDAGRCSPSTARRPSVRWRPARRLTPVSNARSGSGWRRWGCIIRTISGASASGPKPAPAPGWSRFTSSTSPAIRWSPPSAAATAASVPTRSAPSSRARPGAAAAGFRHQRHRLRQNPRGLA